jgi:hypothetical protein
VKLWPVNTTGEHCVHVRKLVSLAVQHIVLPLGHSHVHTHVNSESSRTFCSLAGDREATMPVLTSLLSALHEPPSVPPSALPSVAPLASPSAVPDTSSAESPTPPPSVPPSAQPSVAPLASPSAVPGTSSAESPCGRPASHASALGLLCWRHDPLRAVEVWWQAAESGECVQVNLLILPSVYFVYGQAMFSHGSYFQSVSCQNIRL